MMTATTTPREVKRRDGEIIGYPVAAGVRIPKGALVCIDRAGYATNGTGVVGHLFAGVAYETVDNTEGGAGEAEIRVQTTGTYEYEVNGFCVQGNVGMHFGVVDNQTVELGGIVTAGTCVRIVSPTSVRIRIDRFAS